MAGIAGAMVNDEKIVDKILERIKHRGSKKKLISIGNNVIIGCCLLPTEAKSEGRVFTKRNNFLAAIDGIVFDKDKICLDASSVLIEIYKTFGTDVLNKLDGNFVFALETKDDIILGRSHVGAHPLYYGFKDGNLLFSSEAKGLIGIVNKIEELKPGELFSLKNGLQEIPYSTGIVPSFRGFEEAAQILKELLDNSVKRLLSDGLVDGALLSGGLDSSVVAYLASKYKTNLDTYALGIIDDGDIPYANKMAKFIKSHHRQIIINDEEIKRILPNAIYHLESFEESCVHGAIANYLVGEFAAKNGATCLLCGEGADELLGGYSQLKFVESKEELEEILGNLIFSSYMSSLLRLDRSFSAHSIEYRAPFLDKHVVDFCLKIPINWKIYGHKKIEKWLLKKAFENDLPKSIVQRKKVRFAEGTGVTNITKKITENYSIEKTKLNQKLNINWQFSSSSEMYYYQLFKDFFSKGQFEKLVHKWNPLSLDYKTT